MKKMSPPSSMRESGKGAPDSRSPHAVYDLYQDEVKVESGKKTKPRTAAALVVRHAGRFEIHGRPRHGEAGDIFIIPHEKEVSAPPLRDSWAIAAAVTILFAIVYLLFFPL
jgi:hypothetical protein